MNPGSPKIIPPWLMGHETTVRELRIGADGITLADDSASAAAIIQHGRDSRRGHRDSPASRRDAHGSGR